MAHLGEAIYAVHIATEKECINRKVAWFIQTLLLGYPSLRLLLARERDPKSAPEKKQSAASDHKTSVTSNNEKKVQKKK